MAGEGPYKKLAPLAAQVASGRGLGQVLKTLRTKKDSTNAEEKAEAGMMFAALHGAAKSQFDSAMQSKNSDVLSAIKKFDKIAKDFRGDVLGASAKKESDALKRDPKAKKEIQAAGIWARIEQMNEGLKPVMGRKNPKNSNFRKRNMAAIKNIIGGCQMLVQRYAGTQAAAQAKALMDQYR